jgi:hypothetical protein
MLLRGVCDALCIIPVYRRYGSVNQFEMRNVRSGSSLSERQAWTSGLFGHGDWLQNSSDSLELVRLASLTLNMSNNTVAGGVTGTPYLGGSVLQVNDFFEYASILHPLAVGSIAIATLFATLRISSNRSVAPMNIFDVI